MCAKIIKTLLVVISFCMLPGCQKEFSYLSNDSNNITLENFFERTTTASMQSFDLNTNNGGTFKGTKGTGFSFQPLAFIDLNGNAIRGKIKIRVLEILSPADIILNDAATMSNGLPIESAGAFYISATYNNATAKLAPQTFVKISLFMPSAQSRGMQVFSGNRQDTTFNWVPNNSPGNMIIMDTIQSNGNALDTISSMFSNSLEWINCDRYMNEPKIRCGFTLKDNPDKDSTAVFVQFTGRNSVVRISKDATTDFSSYNLIEAPATVIGICIKNNKLYTSISAVSLKDQQSFNMQFAEDTQEKFKAKLQSLK